LPDERLTDEERQRLISLAVLAFAARMGDQQLKEIVRKLSGVDTVVYIRKETSTDD